MLIPFFYGNSFKNKKHMNNISVFQEYLNNHPKDLHAKFERVYNIVAKAIPDGTACIKYGVPTFMKNDKNIIHFGLFKKHLGLYPGPDAIAYYKSELNTYKRTKGAIQIPYTTDIPESLLKAITEYNLKLILK